MCDACLIESIKSSMLSRRALFTGAAATTAAVMASGLTTARPALAQAAGRVVDLTHAYDGSFPTFDGNPGILYEPAAKFAGSGYPLWKLTVYQHTGTPNDAPLPFPEGGAPVADPPPWTIGAVNLPAFLVVIGTTLLTTPYGVRLAHAMNPKPLKRAFAVFLTLVALNMLRKVLGW